MTRPPCLPSQHLGMDATALARQLLQSSAARSRVHCAMPKMFTKGVRPASPAANIRGDAYAALAVRLRISAPSRDLNSSAGCVAFCVFHIQTETDASAVLVI